MNTVKRAIFPALQQALLDERIIVLTGMRQVGKTTTLHWLLDQIPSANKIYLDLERLDYRSVFSESNYDLILNYLRNVGLQSDQPMTVALDEIQYVPNIPSVVKYLYDHYRIKFLLTGSSSFYLKNYFSESIAGRKIVFEMFPLTFGEFLDFQGIPYRKRETWEEMIFDRHEYERINGYYEEYTAFGGMPGVVLEPKKEVKKEILMDIYSSYINIDVKTMADFRKIDELRKLISLLAMRIGNKLDYTKLSKIIGISRPTLNDYLEFLEMTYVICQLPAYAGPDTATSLGKKLYFYDNGIAGILANPGEGALFENAVFSQLRSYGSLSYLSKANKYEIDFILAGDQRKSTALEVKYHPTEGDDQSLKRAAQRNDLPLAWLIGKHPTPEFDQFLWGGSIL